MQIFTGYILPIAAATIVIMITGVIWHSPLLFGNVWKRLNNFKEDAEMTGQGRGMALELAGSLLLASVLRIFINMPRVILIWHAVWVVLLVWAGFMVTTLIHSLAWQDKPVKLFLLDSAHQLTATIGSGIVLFLFK